MNQEYEVLHSSMTTPMGEADYGIPLYYSDQGLPLPQVWQTAPKYRQQYYLPLSCDL